MITYIIEPYRSFVVFLELLHLDSICNIHDHFFENIRKNYFRDGKTSFPDYNTVKLKTSFKNLEKMGIVEYEKNGSDFNVKLKETNLESVISAFKNNRDQWSNSKYKSILHLFDGDDQEIEEMDIYLDDVYDKKYLLIPVIDSFFSNFYSVAYEPKSKKISIRKIDVEKGEVEKQEEYDSSELNEEDEIEHTELFKILVKELGDPNFAKDVLRDRL